MQRLTRKCRATSSAPAFSATLWGMENQVSLSRASPAARLRECRYWQHIANNGERCGVFDGTGNAILSNIMFSNAQLGIDLGTTA
jgi:hypothetical protein